MNLNFVILYVRDLEQMKTFYTDVLGMTALDNLSSSTFVTVRPENGALIGLQDSAASRLPPGREEHGGSVELSFQVEDADATCQQWKALGIEIVSDPMDIPIGRYFLAKDPEGHYLSIYHFAR